MGNASTSHDAVAIPDNPNRLAFVRYKSMTTVTGGFFGTYNEFFFQIFYRRWHFEVAVRYNDLLKFEKRLIKKYPEQMAHIERLSKSNKLFGSHDQRFLDQRARVMVKFLQLTLDAIPDPMSESMVYKFFQFSAASFHPEYGRKGKEGYLKKSSGGYIEKFSNKLGDYIRVWKWRWIILHDNCITWHKDPDSDEVLGCLQIDHDFGVAQAGRVISLKTGTRRLTFFAPNDKVAREWVTAFQEMYTPRIHRFHFESAFAPRMKNDVRIYINGCEYYQAAALAMLQAQKEIMITSWKNSPTVLMTRAPLPPLRLDQILKYKADQGVNIYVLLYKEVEHIGQGNDSFNVKKKLEELSPNIHVIRHPNKFMGGSTAVLWSHHEKLVIVDRNMAFVGGIDLAFQRWDDEKHRVCDEDGLIFPGNDYRQPAPGVFRPARNIDFETDANDSDEEMIEVVVARPGESLPQATSALVDDDDQPFEVEVVVDFGMSSTAPPTPSAARRPTAAPTRAMASSDAPPARNAATNDVEHKQEDDEASNDSNVPAENDQMDEMTAEELEALRRTAGTEDMGRSSMVSTIMKGYSSTKSSITAFSDVVMSSISQAKAAVDSYAEQYITSKKLKNSNFWEARDLYPRMGWHDVQAGISGRAARDVASHFVQRWNHHRLSTSDHYQPILRDITDDLNFTICARCQTSGIFETAANCPNCQYYLGPVNLFSMPRSTVFLPSPIDRYSFMLFECRFSKASKLPFRLHGDCPAVVTSIISNLTTQHILKDDSEGVILDVGGPMSEWLSAFGLYPAIGDVIATVNGKSVNHLNSNQIKRLIKRIRKGTSATFNDQSDSFSIAFRRHYLENLHPVEKLEDPPSLLQSDQAVAIGADSANAIEPSVPTVYVEPEPRNEKMELIAPNTPIVEAEVSAMAVEERLPTSATSTPTSVGLVKCSNKAAATTDTTSASAADYHPICQAAAHMEISYNISRLFHDYAQFCDCVPRLCEDQGTCKVQVLRSVGKWSIGTKTECSILNCYLDSIRDSHRFIYIENQFFISSLAGDGTQNKIAEALVERILRAYTQKEVFRVIVIIPLHPNGDFASAMKSKVVMHYEYMTINRCNTSLLNQLKVRAPGINTSDYISFYSLRNWGVINNKIVSDQVYVHDKLMIIDDRILIIGSANINDRSMLGIRDSEVALRIEDTFHIDSMLNEQPHTVGYLPFTIRVKLMRQHLGNPDIDLTDPLSSKVFGYWRSVAANNSTYYDELDGPLSYYRCLGSINYKNALDHFPPKSYLDPEARNCVEQIKGFLVDWPHNFFSSEDLSPTLATRAIIPNEMWL